MACHFSCTTCMGPTAEDCTSCPLNAPLEDIINTTVYKNSGVISTDFTKRGKCVTVCPAGQFFDQTLPIPACVSCSGGCVSCRDGNLCFSCISSLDLFQFDADNANCLPFCNVDEYRDFTDPAGPCKDCHEGCKSCNGGAFTNCSGNGCNANYEPMNPNAVAGTHSCMRICNEIGQYRIHSTGTCANCSIDCYKCNGPSNTECTECRSNFDFEKPSPGSIIGECVCNPANNLFQSGTQCIPCDQSCDTCIGSLESQCINCKTGYLDIRNSSGDLISCGLSCPRTDQFYDSIDSQCKPCDDACTVCSGGSINDCLGCPTGKYLHLNTCIDICPIGFSSSDGSSCVPCADTLCTECN